MICKVEDCTRDAKARGMCKLHYQRERFGIDLNKPIGFRTTYAKGWINKEGYRVICTPDGREIGQHRYKMELSLGRRLNINEVVHHKDGNKLNNNINNLELLGRNSHTALHRSHRVLCIVCGKDDNKGANGLCAKHYSKVLRYIQKNDIIIPNKFSVIKLVYMSLALGLENYQLLTNINLLKINRELESNVKET